MALYVKFECATCENENCYGHSLHTTEKVCDGYKHTATNADRIRSMTDEELAEWVNLMVCKYRSCGNCPLSDWCEPGKGIAEWLKATVEVDNG